MKTVIIDGKSVFYEKRPVKIGDTIIVDIDDDPYCYEADISDCDDFRNVIINTEN